MVAWFLTVFDREPATHGRGDLESAMIRLRDLWWLLRTAALAWWNDRAMSMGAAIAFYMTFSLAPMILVVIAVAGLALGEEAARGAVVDSLGGLIGEDGAAAMQRMIESAADTGSGVVGTVVGLATFFILATGALVELQDSLNRIWRTAPPGGTSAFFSVIRTRLVSLAFIVGIGFLLLVSLVLDAALSGLAERLSRFFPGLPIMLAVFNITLSFVGAFVVVSLVFKVMPDTPVRWRYVWFGAGVTTILLAIGKFAIGAYIGGRGLASTYGAAASLIALLLWVYYSAQIFLFGAEITKARHDLAQARHAPGRPGTEAAA